MSSYSNESCRESVKFNIEGLSSLKRLYLGSNAEEVHFNFKNLPSLTRLYLSIDVKIDEDIVERVVNQVPNIQELYLNGQLSYFNLDNFVNLKELLLAGSIEDENFNFELFKNLCNQLETIKILLNEKTIVKLFDGYKFPNLLDFSIECSNIKRLNKELFSRFPSLIRLQISSCRIEIIEHDSLSNMQQLSSLDMSRNEIESIEENAFSMLKNLKTLDLSGNNLRNIDQKFTGLLESVELTI